WPLGRTTMMAFNGMAMGLLFLGGPAGSDVLAAVDPVHYFAARQIDVPTDQMARLAGGTPKDAKTQVMQLLALRYLAEKSDKLKQADKYAEYRRLLEEVAAGKTAQDAQGFAKEYAAIVLARLDGKALAAPPAPKLQDAFA